MKNNISKFSIAVVSVLLAVNGAMAGMLQQPIQATAGVVAPNVMFTLDDSGSMGWECLPDALCYDDKSTFIGTMPDLNPWKNGVAAYDTTCNSMSTTKKNACKLYNRKMRSAGVNPLYYNPAIKYLPWRKSDGNWLDQYPGTAARDFPEVSAPGYILDPGYTKSSTAVQNLAAVLPSMTKNWCYGSGVNSLSFSCSSSADSTVYLAQYFNLIGTDKEAVSSYAQVMIQGSASTYPKSSASARTDCAAASSCTYAEELQNFSNWYSYHRTRMRVGIAGTSESFFSIPLNYRVGYGRINNSKLASIDGSANISTVVNGVRPFTPAAGGNKTAFYTWLASQVPHILPEGKTPLRRAMGEVGKYYSYTGNKGPWGEQPGIEDTTPQLSCRRSFHMLMTDGTWNDTVNGSDDGAALEPAAKLNVDAIAGDLIKNINSQPNYTYSPAYPYQDTTKNTLADVAMYYWNHDLNPKLDNGVTPTSNDPAFWQHMVNYTIGFGVKGVLDPATDLPALATGAKKWPAAVPDSLANIDDLWHAAVNSRGMYLSAKNTDEYSNALKDIIDDIAAVNGSESGLAVSAKTLSTTSTTKKYEAEFSSARWSGDVKAIKLTSAGLDDGDPPWTAAANFPAYGSRNMFAYDKLATGTKGVAFTLAGLSSTMQTTMLGSPVTITGVDLVNYLRGDRTKETGILRVRASMLGDIVNSTPILVKDQTDGQYGFLPKTSAFSAAQSTYRRFLVAKKQRNAQLFVGANDGFLHAFSDTNGAETFAFMPDSLLGKVKDLASLDYTHEYFVDGPLSEADIYDTSASKWRNLVLGGTGAGAKSLFAINVPVVSYPASATAVPAALTASQSAPGASDILWTVSNTDVTAPNNFSELGYVLQPPEHGVMMDGTWVTIVGNGYDSTSKKAQLFIINALTGALIKSLDTVVGSSGTPNGLGGVRVVRNDKKQIVAAYAGDLQGNLWKFDFSSADKTKWAVAFAGNPLFKTEAIEPITAAPTYTLHPNGGVMVLFGTGKIFETGDDRATDQRALYGVWDMVKLGAASTLVADTDTLNIGRITHPETIVAQALSADHLTGTTGLFYGLTVTPVDYEIKLATETRPAYMTKRGWRLPLTVGAGQRLVDNPEMAGGMVLMQTITPLISTASCTASSLTRYGFLLDPFMSGTNQTTFDTNADGLFTAADNVTAAGVLLIGSGPATMLRLQSKNKYLIAQARTGLTKPPLTQPPFSSSKRYWRQIISQPN